MRGAVGAQRAPALSSLTLPGLEVQQGSPVVSQAGGTTGGSDPVWPTWASEGRRKKGASSSVMEVGPPGPTSPCCEPDGIQSRQPGGAPGGRRGRAAGSGVSSAPETTRAAPQRQRGGRPLTTHKALGQWPLWFGFWSHQGTAWERRFQGSGVLRPDEVGPTGSAEDERG